MTATAIKRTAADKVAPLVESANRVPEIAWMLRGWDCSVVLLVDGEEIGIAASGGQARLLPVPPRNARLWFGLTEGTLDLLIAGRLSPLTAKLTGRLQSRGSLTDILRFASIFTACLRQPHAA